MDQLDSTRRDYQHYRSMKGWGSLFQCSRAESTYFAGQFRGIPLPGADVLELGFGSGSFMAWAREHGANVVGIEINDELTACAHAAGFKTLPHNFEAQEALPTSAFDIVVAFDVFEHLTHNQIREKMIAMEKMLRKGGILVLRFPNSQSPFGLAPQHGDHTHRSYLSREVILGLSNPAAWKVLQYSPSYLVSAGNATGIVTAFVRRILRMLIGATLNFIYGQRIHWDPVVVLIIKRL